MTRYAKTMSDALREVQEATLNVKSNYSKDKKVTKKEIQSMENDNEHGEVALALAQSFGTPREVTKVRYINKMHKARGEIIQSDQKERDAIIRKYYKMAEEVEIQEDGHADVASAIRQCKTVTEDAMQILQKLQSMSPEGTLPTWWSNKLAIASNSMNKIRDYLLVPSVAEGLELNEKAGDNNDLKKLVGELQNASKMHLAQSKRVKAHVDMMKAGDLKGTLELVQIVRELEKASEAHLRQSKVIANHMKEMGESVIMEQPEHEIQVGGYTTKHFHMCGSAQKVMKKHADKDGAEELTKLQDKFYEIEKMAMNAGKPTDEQISQTKTLYNQIMSKAKEMGIDDEVGGYMKMHMDSMEKGDPKLGFGRTDKDDGKEPIDEAMKYTHAVVDPDGKVAGMSTNEKDAKDIASRHKGKVVILKKPMSQKKGDMMINRPFKEEVELNESQKDIDFARDALTKANIKHIAKQHPMKRSKIIVNVSRKDYKAAEKALGKEFASQGDNIMLGISESVELDEDSKMAKQSDDNLKSMMKKMRDAEKKDPKAPSIQHMIKRIEKEMKKRGLKEGIELDEKYDLYHSTFSGAMQHAYDYAKKKMGITVDPKEIDNKVATGPRKPTEGKTNTYRLKGKGGNLQIQVYNKGGSKPFELNMYKEEIEMNEKKKLKSGAKFDFQLFDDMKGAKEAEAELNKELHKAVRMKDKETARKHMLKIQMKHSKFGATDTEPREVINMVLDAIFEARKKFNEGYESEVKKVLDKEGIDGYFKNGKLYVSKRDAKDAKKALEDSDEITKLPPMVKEEKDMTKNLKETIMDMWKEAVSPAQQAAIAISKKEKEKEEGNAFTGALKAAKEKGEKTFTVAGKEYDVKTEKLVGGQKKLDKDKDGDIDAKDFAMLRKQKKNEELENERYRYLETKKGSVRESILKMWGEISEKAEKKDLTKSEKHDTKKMTDTGKDITPVDMSPKMPKVKESKNKV